MVQILSSHRPSGRRRIVYELEKRGIGCAVIQEVLQGFTGEKEHALALELARQKQERWKKFDRVKRQKKTYDFLVRRGFDFALSRNVVSEIEA
jgi:regulatory protein